MREINIISTTAEGFTREVLETKLAMVMVVKMQEWRVVEMVRKYCLFNNCSIKFGVWNDDTYTVYEFKALSKRQRKRRETLANDYKRAIKLGAPDRVIKRLERRITKIYKMSIEEFLEYFGT